MNSMKLLVLLFLFSFSGFAQQDDSLRKTPVQVQDECVYFPDIDASFPGGNDSLQAFIRAHLTYPDEYTNVRIQGIVGLQFVVDPDGSIYDIEVVKPVDPLLDKEAVRVVRAMPKWIPAEYGGKKVKARVHLPIRFAIQ